MVSRCTAVTGFTCSAVSLSGRRVRLPTKRFSSGDRHRGRHLDGSTARAHHPGSKGHVRDAPPGCPASRAVFSPLLERLEGLDIVDCPCSVAKCVGLHGLASYRWQPYFQFHNIPGLICAFRYSAAILPGVSRRFVEMSTAAAHEPERGPREERQRQLVAMVLGVPGLTCTCARGPHELSTNGRQCFFFLRRAAPLAVADTHA